MALGQKAKDQAKIVKSTARKHAGRVTGNKRLEAKGKAGEIIGKLRLKGRRLGRSKRRPVFSLSPWFRGGATRKTSPLRRHRTPVR
jgi:uncharacterized protein YjbJ (UPF0337 family)